MTAEEECIDQGVTFLINQDRKHQHYLFPRDKRHVVSGKRFSFDQSNEIIILSSWENYLK